MRVIGIDPGIEKTGFGVVDIAGSRITVHDVGCIFTERGMPVSARLHVLATDLRQIIRQWKPEVAGIEQIFFSRNVKTAMTVSHARGVIIEVMEEHGVPILEFNPGEIKSAITGDARADKLQMRKMLHCTFGMQIKNDDAGDALACAVCTALSARMGSR